MQSGDMKHYSILMPSFPVQTSNVTQTQILVLIKATY